MNIGTQIKTRVQGASAEAVAEVAKKMGSPEGIQVQQESADQATVTIDSAALKVSARTESTEAASKRMQASTLSREANFTRSQANRERSNAREDKTEATQAKNRSEQLKTEIEKDEKDKAEAERQIVVQERAKREAEAAAFQEAKAAQEYKTRGESMLSEAGGDPIKIAQAFDQIESAARHHACPAAHRLSGRPGGFSGSQFSGIACNGAKDREQHKGYQADQRF